jgi:hypothetical protein
MAAYLYIGSSRKKKGNDAIVKVAHKKWDKGGRHLFSKQKKKKKKKDTLHY